MNIVTGALRSYVVFKTLANILHTLFKIIRVTYFDKLVHHTVDFIVKGDTDKIHDITLCVREHRVIKIVYCVARVNKT